VEYSPGAYTAGTVLSTNTISTSDAQEIISKCAAVIRTFDVTSTPHDAPDLGFVSVDLRSGSYSSTVVIPLAYRSGGGSSEVKALVEQLRMISNAF